MAGNDSAALSRGLTRKGSLSRQLKVRCCGRKDVIAWMLRGNYKIARDANSGMIYLGMISSRTRFISFVIAIPVCSEITSFKENVKRFPASMYILIIYFSELRLATISFRLFCQGRYIC